MKLCLIQQPSGLGDILLSIKIASLYSDEGYEIIWPVFPVYSNLNEKIEAPFINFVNMQDKYRYKDVYEKLCRRNLREVYKEKEGDNYFIFVPIKNSFHSSWGKALQRFDSHDASNMLAKFLMCDTTYENWQNYFKLKRDLQKEESLIKHLQIKKDFHLVQKIFGTPPTWMEKLNRDIKTPDNLQRVEVDYIDGYDVFDWIGVFEMASKIDVVSTSSFYFFEKLNLKCKPTIYSRNTPHRSDLENFEWLRKLAKKEYNYIS